MIEVKEHQLIITIQTENSQEYLDRIRGALTDVTAILVESDEFYNYTELPNAIATLIKLQGELLPTS